jgi:NADPH:quinone reductase-like Zn-dependent oxidoreductase
MTSIPETSTSLVLPGIGQPLTLQTSPFPQSAAAGTALVRILAVPLRPHNRDHFAGKGFLPHPPSFNFGYAAIARVLAVGPDAVVLAPGALVFALNFIAARDDPVGTQIMAGLTNANGVADSHPERAAHLFDHWGGLWRDVAVVPLESCHVLDERRLVRELGYSHADLMYLDRLSVAYGAVSAAGLLPGETVVVAPATGHYSGAVVEVAAQLGCRVVALTRTLAKLQPLTARMPAGRVVPLELTGDRAADAAAIRALCPLGSIGADAFIDVSPPQATASPHHFAVGLDALRPGARAVFAGALGDVTINYTTTFLRNLRLIGKFMCTRDEITAMIHTVEAGIFRLGEQAGHESVQGGFKLEDWDKATRVAEEATQWGRHVVFLP